MRMIAIACLLVGLSAGCAGSPMPSPTVRALSTATPTPTLGGTDRSNTARSVQRAVTTNARHLAKSFDQGGAERDYFLNRYVVVTGVTVRVNPRDDAGRLVVVLEGAAGTGVVCERPWGFTKPRELFQSLPPDGLPVLVAGRVSASRTGEDVVLADCVTLKTGMEVTGFVARIPAITNIFQGWGLFWAWALFASIGIPVAVRLRRVGPPWMLAAFVLSHTAGMATLYALLGSLVLPFYDASGVGSLAVWPFILILNPT